MPRSPTTGCRREDSAEGFVSTAETFRLGIVPRTVISFGGANGSTEWNPICQDKHWFLHPEGQRSHDVIRRPSSGFRFLNFSHPADLPARGRVSMTFSWRVDTYLGRALHLKQGL